MHIRMMDKVKVTCPNYSTHGMTGIVFGLDEMGDFGLYLIRDGVIDDPQWWFNEHAVEVCRDNDRMANLELVDAFHLAEIAKEEEQY